MIFQRSKFFQYSGEKIAPVAWGINAFLLIFWLPVPPVYSYIIVALTGFSIICTKLPDSIRERNVIATLILIFALGSILTIVFSRDVQRSISTSLYQEVGILVFFLIAYGYKGVNDFLLTYIVLSITAVAITVYLLVVAILHIDMEPLIWVKVSGVPIMLVPNDIGFPCLLTPIFLGLCSYLKRKILYLSFLAYLSLLIVTASIYQSAVGLLCLGVSFTTYSILTKDKRIVYILALILIMAVIPDLFLKTPLSAKFILAVKQGGWDPRFALWLVALGMFLNAPFTGYGPHTFVNYYNDAVSRLDLPADLIIDDRMVPWVHNLYLELLAERGVFVFLVFMVLIITSMFFAWRTLKSVTARSRNLAAAAISSMCGFYVGAFFEFSFLRIWVVIFFYAIIALMVRINVLKSG